MESSEAVRLASLIPWLAAAAAVAATARLGFWQLERAHQKEALQAQYERMRAAAPVDLARQHIDLQHDRYRRVVVSGEFEPQHEILLDNQVNQGRAGYHVLTPLRIYRGERIMVNRGWIGRIKEYPSIPQIQKRSGTITLTGIIDTADRKLIELSHDTVQGKVWQNFTAERFRERTGLALLPFMLVQQDASDDGLVRLNTEPDFGITRHYGYAVQWFALAATVIVIYVVLTLKRNRKAPQS